MTTSRIAASLALGLLAGCSLDFNEAIPCVDSSNCPGGQTCDVTVQRCTASAIDDLDAADGSADASDVADDGADSGSDGGRPDLGGDDVDAIDADPDVEDASDTAADTPADTATDTATDTDIDTSADGSGAGDSGADTATDADPDADCVPVAEICDGLDNDCDDVADNGVDCGPCGPGAVLVSPAALPAYCIDLYEASRVDATATSVGTDDSSARSVAGVLPWSPVALATAETACAAVGKRLCLAEEWQYACAGAEGWSFPYNRSIYEAATCHGPNAAPRTSTSPTGAFPECISDAAGAFDMSGNVAEWAVDGRALGGGYTDSQAQLRCQGANPDVDPIAGSNTVGFRCCGTPR